VFQRRDSFALAALESSRFAKDKTLSARKSDFSAVLKHENIAHQIHDSRVLNVFKVNDAIAPGTEELCSVEPFLAVAKGAADKHRGADPIDAAVISLRFQSQQIRHAKDATLDVVRQDDEIVVVQRLVAAELVKNFTSLGLEAVFLRGRGKHPVFDGIAWLFRRAEAFSIYFRLHGVTKIYGQNSYAE